MSVWGKRGAALAALAAAGTLAAAPVLAGGGEFGLGREATPKEVAGWDIDVPPDAAGMPEGSGTAAEGEEIYANQCAMCHGVFGEGAGRYPALMGGEDSLKSPDPVKTVGSYWPYATTLWDYIHRAMPFGNAQSLTYDQTYAVTAYVLYLNNLVDMDEELTPERLAAIEMPNADGFIRPDPRPDVPTGEPCMTDCKDTVKIIGRATEIGVTPED